MEKIKACRMRGQLAPSPSLCILWQPGHIGLPPVYLERADAATHARCSSSAGMQPNDWLMSQTSICLMDDSARLAVTVMQSGPLLPAATPGAHTGSKPQQRHHTPKRQKGQPSSGSPVKRGRRQRMASQFIQFDSSPHPLASKGGQAGCYPNTNKSRQRRQDHMPPPE